MTRDLWCDVVRCMCSRGYNSRIEAKHLPPVPTADRVGAVSQRWTAAWNEQAKGLELDDPNNTANVVTTIKMLFSSAVIYSALLELVWVASSFATPYIVKALMKYIVTGGALSLGIGLAIALAVRTNALPLLTLPCDSFIELFCVCAGGVGSELTAHQLQVLHFDARRLCVARGSDQRHL